MHSLLSDHDHLRGGGSCAGTDVGMSCGSGIPTSQVVTASQVLPPNSERVMTG
jgi:hypothetical protein